VSAGFGGCDADAEPTAEDGRSGEDRGADPQEKSGRDFPRDVLRGEEVSQDRIAAKHDAVEPRCN